MLAMSVFVSLMSDDLCGHRATAQTHTHTHTRRCACLYTCRCTCWTHVDAHVYTQVRTHLRMYMSIITTDSGCVPKQHDFKGLTCQTVIKRAIKGIGSLFDMMIDMLVGPRDRHVGWTHRQVCNLGLVVCFWIVLTATQCRSVQSLGLSN